jgi:hypothetical protein
MRKGQKMSAEQRERLRQAFLRPEVRERRSAITKAKWRDPESRQRRIAGLKSAWEDPERHARIVGAIRDSWDDPEKRERHIQGIRIAAARPEVQAKKSASMKRTLATPGARERAIAAHRGQWDDPEKRKAMGLALKKTLADPEVMARKSKALKVAWQTRDREAHTRFMVKWHAGQKEKLAAAWRPDDWMQKPIDWRIIGNELLSRQDRMSNEELGKRLDDGRLSKCPYGKTWLEALDSKSKSKNYSKRATDLVSEIRQWVGRPGGRLRNSGTA